MEEFEPDLIVSYKGPLQIIRFNRPKKRNAFGDKIYKGVRKAFHAGAENENVSITVLTGTGSYYSSGNDLTALSLSDSNFEDLLKEKLERTKEFIQAFIDYPKLLVAVVNGPAVGVAVTTLGLCDIVFATNNATFHTPFTSLGISAEGCSTYTFPKIMGQSMATKMLCFNYKMGAEEAKSCGLVGELVSPNKLDSVFEKLESYGKLPPMSLLYTKKLIRDAEKTILTRVNEIEMERLVERFQSDECMNAIMDFMMRKSKL